MRAQWILAATTAAGSMGMGAGGAAGALLAMDMTGSSAAAGLPLGAVVVGSAIGALLISRVTRLAGRFAGLVVGYAVGSVGAGLVVVAAIANGFGLVVAGSVMMGVANAAVFLTRYAAADSVPEAARGRALGAVLAGAAVGAVVSFNLLGPSGDLAAKLGMPRLTGLYVLAVVAFGAAGSVVAALGYQTRGAVVVNVQRAANRAVPNLGRQANARTAVLLLGVTNLVMVGVMTIAPVHMVAHGHDLNVVGVAVSIHALGMFAPAPLAGWLADRSGPMPVARLGLTLMVVAGITGGLADGHNAVTFTVVLALLGLGWCAGVVAGSTMLAASLPDAERPRAEGIGEVAMGLAAGAGAPLAGVVAGAGGFATLAVAAAGVSLVVLLAARRAGGAVTASDQAGRTRVTVR